MCFSFINKSDPLPPIYGRSGIDLREFRPCPNRNILHSGPKYFAKVAVSSSRMEDASRVAELAKKILSKLPVGFKAYTHFWYYQHVNGQISWYVLSNHAYRLIKNQDGTFQVQKVSWEQVDKNHPEHAQLQNDGYAYVDLRFFYGFHKGLIRSKKRENDLLMAGLIDKTEY